MTEKHHGPSEEGFYQEGEAPLPDDIPPDVIISPDTRRTADRVPPGQTRTRKWPVLDAHGTPEFDIEHWQFTVGGLVENSIKLDLEAFMALPTVRVFGDFHCVTRWSRLGNIWTGVPTRHIANQAGVDPEAKFVSIGAYDHGWTTNVPIENFLAEDSLFAWLHDGQPLLPDHGGPVRLIIPTLYAWKSAKWVNSVTFLKNDKAGYWEEGGYHMRGNPWVGEDGERYRW
jgi:DMSO/TMAO reductase YedYZ molybdopterin-dependent catalytic subunit